MIAIQNYLMAMNPSVMHRQPNQAWNQPSTLPTQPHVQPVNRQISPTNPAYTHSLPATVNGAQPHIEMGNSGHPHMQSPLQYHVQPGAFPQNQPHAIHSAYYPTPAYPPHPYVPLPDHHRGNTEP